MLINHTVSLKLVSAVIGGLGHRQGFAPAFVRTLCRGFCGALRRTRFDRNCVEIYRTRVDCYMPLYSMIYKKSLNGDRPEAY